MVLLFVYGTLRHGQANHGPLADQRCLGVFRTRTGYVLLDLGEYPGLVRAAAGGAVEGEVYEVGGERLPLLDAIEGAPALFRREPVAVEGIDRAVEAYFYRGSTAGWSLCPDGRWTGPEGSP